MFLRQTFMALIAVTVLSTTPTVGRAEAPKAAAKQTVAVAAASDLKFALDAVIAAYTKEHADTDIKVTYGSSGNFFTQITEKAPFDLFLSADISYPQQLIEKKLAQADTLFVYAIGRLVLWAPKGSPLNVEKVGLAALSDPKARKIAIANPKHAPYGRAAEALLKNKGLYAGVESRLVFGENISQTAEFVRSGNADLGFIALSLAVAPTMKDHGTYFAIPADDYPKLEQAGVILANAKDVKATAAFRAFVVGERGQAILKEFGFTRPGA